MFPRTNLGSPGNTTGTKSKRNKGRIRIAAFWLPALILFAGKAASADWPSEQLGEARAWDSAYDEKTKTRFIPFQLIVPGKWGGDRKIEIPEKVDFVDGGGDFWSGPIADADLSTGDPIVAFKRHRSTRREVSVNQRFAVRKEGDGIGRVYDSRFGEIRCSGEIKFPLGLWREGETRRNEYVCASKNGQPHRRFNIITIEMIDYSCRGVSHCLQFTWRHYKEGQAEPLDNRRYTFAPGRGQIGAARL